MKGSVSEQIRKAVARCIQNGTILRVGNIAQRILDVSSDHRVSSDLICRMLLEAGIAAGVPMEINSPRLAERSRYDF